MIFFLQKWLIFYFPDHPDLNDCDPQPCLYAEKCTNLIADYTCDCVAHYISAPYISDLNDCDPQPCLHNGKCTDLIADYRCDCVDPYIGKNCQLGQFSHSVPALSSLLLPTSPDSIPILSQLYR